MSPREIDLLSLWEFAAVQAGYLLANGGEEKLAPPTNEEFYAMTRTVH